VLDGGAGNDYLQGNGGGDTFVFGRGYGQDIINDFHTDATLSALAFNSDTAPADVTASKSGLDLVLAIAGTTDQVTVKNYFASSQYQPSEIEFSDGTVWALSTIETMAL